MKSFIAVAAFAGAALAADFPIKPASPIAAGCNTAGPETFQIQTVNVTTSSRVKRQTPPSEGPGHTLTITLANGMLTDEMGRTGYIASNDQFQFDYNGGQSDLDKFNAGWSICPNGTLALGPSTIFYQCDSGGFFNLYDASQGAQCSPIYIYTLGSSTPAPAPASSSSSSVAPATTTVSTAPPVTVIPDGQPQATTPAASAPSQISDGQVQAPAGASVSQIGDGQVQGSNATYSAPVPAYTGAAAALAPGMGALAAGAIAIALL